MSKWRAQVSVKWAEDAPVWDSWDWMKEWPEVTWAASTMGEWDMTMWVNVSTPDDLEKFIHNKLRSKSWVKDTQSTWTKEVWAA